MPSVWAFSAIGVMTEAGEEPPDHGELVDRQLYCAGCRQKLNWGRSAALVGMIAVMGLLAWAAGSLLL